MGSIENKAITFEIQAVAEQVCCESLLTKPQVRDSTLAKLDLPNPIKVKKPLPLK